MIFQSEEKFLGEIIFLASGRVSNKARQDGICLYFIEVFGLNLRNVAWKWHSQAARMRSGYVHTEVSV